MAGENYFRCDPEKFCKDASCCRDGSTLLAMSVADYVRISRFTREPLEQIWSGHGDVVIMHYSGMDTGQFSTSLGLAHHPCPYLSGTRCDIYEARPVSCALFPLYNYVKDPEGLKREQGNYECLKCAGPNPEHVKLLPKISAMLRKTADLEREYVWRGNMPIDISGDLLVEDPGYLKSIALRAGELQAERVSRSASPRSQAVGESITRVKKHLQLMNLMHPKPVPISIVDLETMLRPLVFSVIEDEVAMRFRNMKRKVLEHYDQLNAEWDDLKKKIN